MATLENEVSNTGLIENHESFSSPSASSSNDSEDRTDENEHPLEIRRSSRPRVKTKVAMATSSPSQTIKRPPKPKQEAKKEDIVLLDSPEEFNKPERFHLQDVLAEVNAQKMLDPNLGKPDEGLTELIHTVTDITNRMPPAEPVVSSAVIELDADDVQLSKEAEAAEVAQKAISEWYDVLSKKSAEEVQEEVDKIMQRNEFIQLRPNLKRANISCKAEERFYEHVFERAKLRKRRLSEDEAEDNDLYIPSQPKLYKKAFVVEEIREMEIDRLVSINFHTTGFVQQPKLRY